MTSIPFVRFGCFSQGNPLPMYWPTITWTPCRSMYSFWPATLFWIRYTWERKHMEEMSLVAGQMTIQLEVVERCPLHLKERQGKVPGLPQETAMRARGAVFRWHQHLDVLTTLHVYMQSVPLAAWDAHSPRSRKLAPSFPAGRSTINQHHLQISGADRCPAWQ